MLSEVLPCSHSPILAAICKFRKPCGNFVGMKWFSGSDAPPVSRLERKPWGLLFHGMEHGSRGRVTGNWISAWLVDGIFAIRRAGGDESACRILSDGDAGQRMSPRESGELIGKIFVYGLLLLGGLGGGIFFLVALFQVVKKKTKGWFIASLVSGILAMLCMTVGLVLVAGKASEMVLEARAKAGVTQRFFSEDGSSHLDAPKGWFVRPGLNPYANLGIASPGERACAMVLTDDKADIDGDLEYFDQMTMAMMVEALENGEQSKAETRTVGGCPAIYHRMTGRVNGIDIVYHRYSIESANSYHQVFAWTSISLEELMRPEMMKILQSFGSDDGPPSVDGNPGDQVSEVMRNRVARVIANTLRVDGESISMDQSLVQDLGMDELAMSELLNSLNEEFDISLGEDEGGKLVTVADVAMLIESKANTAN